MKVRRTSGEDISPGNAHETIVSIWRELGSPVVGAGELTQLQNALASGFGPDEVPSPARIARELAQEGAVLRHPEIIETDARWRESQIANRGDEFQTLATLQAAEALQLDQAATIIGELEELRCRFTDAGDDLALSDLKSLVIEARQAASNRSKNSTLSIYEREVQVEILDWLRVWLETPNLFNQWLELRQSSTAFREKFLKSD